MERGWWFFEEFLRSFVGKFTGITKKIGDLHKKCGLKTGIFFTVVFLGSLVGAFCYLFEKYTEELDRKIWRVHDDLERKIEDLGTEISSTTIGDEIKEDIKYLNMISSSISAEIEQAEQDIEDLKMEISNISDEIDKINKDIKDLKWKS